MSLADLRQLRSRVGAWAAGVGYDVRAGRAVTVFEEDRFVVSYPRSGNTWFRFLVANALGPEREVSFSNIESLVPDIYANRERTLRRLPSPRVLKSHEYFDPRYGRVVYLVRDPRKVAPSYYRFLRMMNRLPEESVDRFVERFIAGRLDRYGSWDAHVGSWLGARRDDRFALVRYEDLQRDTVPELMRALAGLGLEAGEATASRAVERASRDRMQALEHRDAHRWKAIRGADPNVAFVGSGGDDLEPAWERASAAIAEAWGERMRELGYETP